MKRILVVTVLVGGLVFAPGVAHAEPADAACWGQASRVFAQTGLMGEHASEQPVPRLGLRNLARALHAQGIIEDDTLQALGAFVAAELGLEIEACQ